MDTSSFAVWMIWTSISVLEGPLLGQEITWKQELKKNPAFVCIKLILLQENVNVSHNLCEVVWCTYHGCGCTAQPSWGLKKDASRKRYKNASVHFTNYLRPCLHIPWSLCSAVSMFTIMFNIFCTPETNWIVWEWEGYFHPMWWMACMWILGDFQSVWNQGTYLTPNLCWPIIYMTPSSWLMLKGFELTFQVYLFYLVVIDTHHTTCGLSLWQKYLVPKSMLQMRNLELKTLYYHLGVLSVEFHPVSFYPAVWNSFPLGMQ